MLRIYGNRVLKTLPGLDTRPTSARVREALFNIWQGRRVGCSCRDLCNFPCRNCRFNLRNLITIITEPLDTVLTMGEILKKSKGIECLSDRALPLVQMAPVTIYEER